MHRSKRATYTSDRIGKLLQNLRLIVPKFKSVGDKKVFLFGIVFKHFKTEAVII